MGYGAPGVDVERFEFIHFTVLPSFVQYHSLTVSRRRAACAEFRLINNILFCRL